jgi:SM-20-related protein
MPRAAFFQNLGLFVTPGFLEPRLCDQLRGQLSQARSTASTLVSEQTSNEGVLNQSVRKTESVHLEGPIRAQIRRRFLDLMPALEDHFQLALADCQGPEFLSYKTGAFYLAHRDASKSGPQRASQRRVSAVLFLNAQSKEPAEDTYGGGALMFYGLLEGSQREKAGLPLAGESGLLVAFRSDLLHEVQPITFGRRYTAVGWFTT